MSQSQPLRRARAIRRDLVPSHQRTEATQDNRAIERSLMADLNTYVNLIRTELEKSNKTHQWTALHSILIPALRPSVYQTMRSHIGKSYELGAQYVTSRVGLQDASFLTHTDIDNIKILTEEYTNKFFGRVGLSLNNTINRSFAKNEEPDSSINPNYITNAIAISASTKALAEGTRAKARSLLVANKGINPQAILSAADAEKKKKKQKKKPVPIAVPLLDDELMLEEELATTTSLGLAAGISLASLAAQQLQDEMRWVWVTVPEACPICSDLEGEIFTMDDLDFMPMPITDTHDHCRCRVLLL